MVGDVPSMELLGGFACFPWIVTLGHHVLTFYGAFLALDSLQ